MSADRNKGPILSSLKKLINPFCGKMLEISSGTGQHVSFFASNFPYIEFQPTEFDLSLLESINAYTNDVNLSNVLPAKFLDVSTEPNQWLDGELIENKYDYVLNVNMMHISEWKCTEGLFKGSFHVLTTNGKLFTYGPYADNGVITPQSNVNFNLSLMSRNSDWGLRDITKQLVPIASKYSFKLTEIIEMPSNNKLLVWSKSNLLVNY